jgi:hypothetical protein
MLTVIVSTSQLRLRKVLWIVQSKYVGKRANDEIKMLPQGVCCNRRMAAAHATRRRFVLLSPI